MKFINKKFRIIFLLSTFYLTFSTSSATAAELKYFDFSPDISGSLIIYNSETPYQYFIPYDDYISGFDMWAENTGNAGTASFGLRDSNNNLLASKTITIPYLAKQWGGKKIHIQFDEPVNVVSGNIYKIKILSSMPKLKIYYGNLINLQLHNSNELQDFHIKPAYLGDNEQNFVFKFSLYEDGDLSGPIISNVNVSVLTNETAKLNFNANEPIDYKIIYWPIGEANQQTNYSGNYISCYGGIKICNLEISILPNKNYAYQFFAKDIWGNENFIEGNFVSLAGWVPENSTSSIIIPLSTSSQSQATSTESLPDISGPVISVVNVIFLTANSVKISWKTDEAANSSLLIGLNMPGQQVITSVGDTTYELEHILNSGGVLHPDINYYAKITSGDISGNYSSHQFNFNTFKDSLIQDLNQQEQQNQQNQQDNEQQSALNITTGNNNTEVSWNNIQQSSTNGYRIDIFDKNKKLVKQIFVSGDINNAFVKDLADGDYYLVTYADNNGIYEKIAAAQNFTINAQDQKKWSNFGELIKNPLVYIFVFGLLIIAMAGIIKLIKIAKLK